MDNRRRQRPDLFATARSSITGVKPHHCVDPAGRGGVEPRGPTRHPCKLSDDGESEAGAAVRGSFPPPEPIESSRPVSRAHAGPVIDHMNLDGVSHPDSLQRHASGGRRRVESVREEVSSRTCSR